MKRIGIVTTTLLSAVLIGTATFGLAQDDKHGSQDKQDRHAQGSRSSERSAQNNHAQGRGDQQGQRAQDSRQRSQPTRNDHMRPEPQRQRQNNMHGHRAGNFDQHHQTWEQRGGYHGYVIPQRRFSQSFGRNHSFRMSRMHFIGNGANQRFQYGGYWMTMMEPYPEYWGDGWYRSDDMYVDFDGGGYYLYDRKFPGRPGIALSISF